MVAFLLFCILLFLFASYAFDVKVNIKEVPNKQSDATVKAKDVLKKLEDFDQALDELHAKLEELDVKIDHINKEEIEERLSEIELFLEPNSNETEEVKITHIKALQDELTEITRRVVNIELTM